MALCAAGLVDWSHASNSCSSARSSGFSALQLSAKAAQTGPWSENVSKPSVVFHVLGYEDSVLPWAKQEVIHLFVPNQSLENQCMNQSMPDYPPRVWEPDAWWAAQRQYMRSIEALISNHPHADYYMLVDADTFVFPSKLHALLAMLESETLDPDDDLYMGHAISPLQGASEVPAFIMTGGGALLRGRTLRKLRDFNVLDQCAKNQLHSRCWWHCDWVLGDCLSKVGVKPVGHTGFQQFVDRSPAACNSDSIACHPVRSLDQETMLSDHANHTATPLTKTLAEICGKSYNYMSANISTCQEMHEMKPPFKNLCVDDRIVPELFVLGAQKAGTSSLARALISIPGVLGTRAAPGEPAWHWKEAHAMETPTKDYEQWLQGYPRCTAETRIVTTDMTPNYLASEDAPRNINKRYGSQAHHIHFVVVLREPLSRAQSAFYHYRVKAKEWCNDIHGDFNTSFKYYIQRRLLLNKSVFPENTCDDPFGRSEYAPQLQRFFAYFKASQFTIAPFGLSVQDTAFAHYLAERHGLLPIAKAPHAMPVTNVHGHEPLEKDLQPFLLEAQAISYRIAGPMVVAAALATSEAAGAELYGFQGHRTSVLDVSKWLDSFW